LELERVERKIRMATIGIYRITSPTGRHYIGQAVDIHTRWYAYKRMSCTGQPKLYQSLKKYGVEAHTFEVEEVCEGEILNERERFYQEKYNAVEEGLNCRLTGTSDKSGYLSEETKSLLSKNKRERDKDPELRKSYGRSMKGELNPMYGAKRSDTSARNTGPDAHVNRPEVKAKIRDTLSIKYLILDIETGEEMIASGSNHGGELLGVPGGTFQGYPKDGRVINQRKYKKKITINKL
jgi:group I intron endonuclease